MSYIPLENLIDKTQNSIYKLVAMASERAFEIAEGGAPLIGKIGSSKPGSIALEEISQGKVKLKQPKAKKA